MPATVTKATKQDGPCRVVQPEVHLPTASQLERLDAPDRVLLLKLLREPVEFIAHDLFAKASAERILFGGKAVLRGGSTYFDEDESTEFPNDGNDSTLTTAQEILLFQRYNYTRMRIARLIEQFRHKRLPIRAIGELLAWAHRCIHARGQIVQANIPLVLAMAKRTRLNGLDFNELVSEGNFALLRSADKFDCARGFKFSTYACRAILKSFSRVAMRASRYRGHFPTEFDPSLEKSDFADHKRDDLESACVDEIRDILARNRAELNDIEQRVIRERFALDTTTLPIKGKTLEQVGEIIGVTKERVRQIQNKALAKIRTVLEDNLAA